MERKKSSRNRRSSKVIKSVQFPTEEIANLNITTSSGSLKPPESKRTLPPILTKRRAEPKSMERLNEKDKDQDKELKEADDSKLQTSMMQLTTANIICSDSMITVNQL